MSGACDLRTWLDPRKRLLPCRTRCAGAAYACAAAFVRRPVTALGRAEINIDSTSHAMLMCRSAATASSARFDGTPSARGSFSAIASATSCSVGCCAGGGSRHGQYTVHLARARPTDTEANARHTQAEAYVGGRMRGGGRGVCDVCPFEESGAGGDGCALARSRHSQADHLGFLEHEQQLSAAVRTLWLSSVCVCRRGHEVRCHERLQRTADSIAPFGLAHGCAEASTI